MSYVFKYLSSSDSQPVQASGLISHRGQHFTSCSPADCLSHSLKHICLELDFLFHACLKCGINKRVMQTKTLFNSQLFSISDAIICSTKINNVHECAVFSAHTVG